MAKKLFYGINAHFYTVCILVALLFSGSQLWAQAVQINSFSPSTVSVKSKVVINGSGFTGVTAADVKFGGISASSVTVNASGTQITAVVNNGASGNVTVTKSGNTASLPGLTYVAPADTNVATAKVTRIITDFNDYWSSTAPSTDAAQQPDTRHNLFAFEYMGTMYSTGSNQAATTLNNNGVSFTPGNYRAIPIRNLVGTVGAGSSNPNLIVLASKIDGSAATQVATAAGVAGLTVRDVLIDGIRGLDIGTGVTNLPASAELIFNASSIVSQSINDNIPDILVSQIAEPSDNSKSIYCFTDVNGNIIGNPIDVSLNQIPAVGRYKSDFFTLPSGESLNTAAINGSTTIGANTRDVRLVAFKLIDFGINDSNKDAVVQFRVLPSGTSDPAFIAYNRNSFNIPAPVITQEPVSKIACPGSSTTFTVVATGSELEYQWKKNNINIPGATGPSYTINPVQASDAAAYSVVVSNSSGSVVSNVVYLNTTIAVQPVGAITCQGTATSLNVDANGASLVYKWYSNTTNSNTGGTLIPNANTDTYSPPVNVAGTRYYYAVINNNNQTCTNVTTNAVAVTVNAPSAAGTATGNATICSGSFTQITIAGNTGTVQWQSSNNPNSGFTNVTGGVGATTATYTTAPLTATTYFRAQVTNGTCGAAVSNIVTITVNENNTWTGAVSKQWNTGANWSCGVAPNLSLNAIIPVVSSNNYPVIDGEDGVASCKNLTIATNANVIVSNNGSGQEVLSGGLLQIAGTINNSGVLDSRAGSIAMLGSVAQVIPENVFQANSIRNLLIDNTAGVTLGGPLDITGVLNPAGGTFNTSGVLTLKSNIATTAMIAPVTGTVNGNMTIERYVPARRAFRLISSPVTGGSIRSNWQEGGSETTGFGTDITGAGGAANGFDTSGSNNPSLFTFDNAGGTSWNAVTNTITKNLVAGEPLRLMVRGDRTIDQTNNAAVPTPTTLRSTGVIKTGNVPVTLRQTAGQRTFIGNPYQAPVDMTQVLANGTNVVNQFYYAFDPTLGGQPTVGQQGGRGAFVTILLTPNGSLASNSASVANRYLQPNQAAFVQTANNGPASIVFREQYKNLITNATPNLYRNDIGNDIATLKLQMYDANSLALNDTPVDGLIVQFGQEFSNDLDNMDAPKMSNQDENVGIMNGDKKLSVERRSLPQPEEVISLFNTQYVRTNYTYVMQLEGLTTATALLIDKYTQTTTEITNDSETVYNFTVDGSEESIASNRFDIVFEAPAMGTGSYTTTDVKIYPNPNTGNGFYISVPDSAETTTVAVYNTLGQKVYAGTAAQSGNIVSVTPQTVMAAGVYTVQVTNNGKTSVKKLIIK